MTTFPPDFVVTFPLGSVRAVARGSVSTDEELRVRVGVTNLVFFRHTTGRFAEADFLPARHHLSSIYVEPQSDGSAKAYSYFQFIGTRGLDRPR